MSTAENATASAAAALSAAVVTGDLAVGAMWGAWEWSVLTGAERAVELAVQAEVQRLESDVSR